MWIIIAHGLCELEMVCNNYIKLCRINNQNYSQIASLCRLPCYLPWLLALSESEGDLIIWKPGGRKLPNLRDSLFLCVPLSCSLCFWFVQEGWDFSLILVCVVWGGGISMLSCFPWWIIHLPLSLYLIRPGKHTLSVTRHWLKNWAWKDSCTTFRWRQLMQKHRILYIDKGLLSHCFYLFSCKWI